jgi:ATP-dependent Clp protease ATP-binding subunit ClpA
LQEALHRTVALAVARKHEYYTLEHLLLALIDESDAAGVLEGCDVDLARLRDTVAVYVDNELKSLVVENGEEPGPTAGVHRVIHRAVIHVQSAGRDAVTGANALIAIYSERESHAFHFLQQTGMTRYDAVNFVAHGIRKGGRAA